MKAHNSFCNERVSSSPAVYSSTRLHKQQYSAVCRQCRLSASGLSEWMRHVLGSVADTMYNQAAFTVHTIFLLFILGVKPVSRTPRSSTCSHVCVGSGCGLYRALGRSIHASIRLLPIMKQASTYRLALTFEWCGLRLPQRQLLSPARPRIGPLEPILIATGCWSALHSVVTYWHGMLHLLILLIWLIATLHLISTSFSTIDILMTAPAGTAVSHEQK